MGACEVRIWDKFSWNLGQFNVLVGDVAFWDEIVTGFFLELAWKDAIECLIIDL